MYEENFNYFKKILENNTLSHSYLFTGEKNFFKTRFINTLSKACIYNDFNFKENFIQKENENIKNNKEKIEEIKIKTDFDINLLMNLDFLLIKENEKNIIPSEEIIKIEEFASLKNYFSKYKVIVIENLDLMDKIVQNKLLKFIEEPPKNIVIFMLAENVNNIIKTILSRSIQIYIKLPTNDELKDYIINKYLEFDKEAFEFSLGNIKIYDEFLNNDKKEDFKNFLIEFSNILNINYNKNFDFKKLFNENFDLNYLFDIMIVIIKDLLYYKNGGNIDNTRFLKNSFVKEILSNLNISIEKLYKNLKIIMKAKEMKSRNQNQSLIEYYIVYNINIDKL